MKNYSLDITNQPQTKPRLLCFIEHKDKSRVYLEKPYSEGKVPNEPGLQYEITYGSISW